ncbi:peptidase M10/serralysin-like protein [Novosphingobium kunmingense]|uniref:Peptidase M10/serralysin-like protein n=1 Tax=Novosphingobium kunmingense TaxID=1211806 RepID=A0A2N0H717_9SPHN|nr:M10 family metallopeptidase C-terminal domain-containing protein [Novosphingobium kunmingense]PKB14731.1 peptidase M10/serralysin-like protein [Novosphingobium kunmingense]
MAKQAVKTYLEPDTVDLAVNGEIADASAFNLSNPSVYRDFGLPDLATPGEVIRGKTVYDLTGDWDSTRPGANNIMTQLDSGLKQDTSDGVITFAFYNGKHALGLNNNPSFGEGGGYTPFSSAQKAAARIAMTNWDDLIAARIVEVTNGPGAKSWAQNTVDIFLANTTTGPAQAWAYYPGYGNQYTRVAGDVWIASPSVNGSNAQLDPGFYGLQTLNHEIGHALGLSHPGDYNFGDDSDGDGQPDPITYEGDAFYFQDNGQYTVMSYFDAYEAGNNQVDWNLMRFIYPSTPMVDDIAVIQEKYGADYSTRAGDTTYGFNATADVTNAAMKFVSGEMLTIFTIWDGGGTDTLDLSGYHTNSVIDLREGAYSSAGGFGAYNAALADTDPSAMSKADYLAFVNANNSALGLGTRTAAYDLYFGGRAGANEDTPWFEIMGKETLMENNIGIARGAVIENAIGGSGDDRINGNQANNNLTGGAGADTFVIAKYGATDTSTDTITDFKSGEDKLDFTSFAGLTIADVQIDNANDMVKIDTDGNGSLDMTLIVKGDDVVATDFIFG